MNNLEICPIKNGDILVLSFNDNYTTTQQTKIDSILQDIGEILNDNSKIHVISQHENVKITVLQKQ